jgi:molybdenum cofactor guanylyltransferase
MQKANSCERFFATNEPSYRSAVGANPRSHIRSASYGAPPEGKLCQSEAAADGWIKGSFSAALLSGGRSVRMGRDKAQIAVSWEGQTVPLRVRQLRILGSLGPAELFHSGPANEDELCGATIVADQWSDAGPLSGITSCLRLTTSDLLLCLAVDVAHVDVPILLRLLGKCRSNHGIVPRIGQHYEPLVAVYPKASLPLAIEQITARRLRLQDFIRRLLNEQLVSEYPVSDREIALFANWNRPEDTDRFANSR